MRPEGERLYGNRRLVHAFLLRMEGPPAFPRVLFKFSCTSENGPCCGTLRSTNSHPTILLVRLRKIAPQEDSSDEEDWYAQNLRLRKQRESWKPRLGSWVTRVCTKESFSVFNKHICFGRPSSTNLDHAELADVILKE